ncbi:MAG: hypothetical protein A2X36_03380 [Elusimicrobia bacterium GWA2_69_24]|nr:MAG: hypothetical protein A2X36_03380 [Elusimicrobia bacterium GWA2_69_24]HBL15845.1 hypothetical protein [Elusimicrobiota bacterium]
MSRIVSIVAVLLFVPRGIFALETPLDFDQGVDASALAGELQTQAKEGDGLKAAEFARATFREDRDCTTFSFGPQDPLRSERVELRSAIYEWVCYPDPYYPNPPNYPYPPNQPPYYPRPRVQAGQNCQERWVRTEHRSVRMEISGRGEMLPWERDVFEVCLQGQFLNAYVTDASHKYDLDVPGWSGDLVQARAIQKTAAEPDPAGIQAESFLYDAEGGSLVLSLRDRWAQFYKGERVRVQLVVKRDVPNWFDETALDKELELPAADAYKLRVADYASELRSDLKPGKPYYAEWRFKRVGQVSKNSWQKKLETARAEYQGKPVPASPAMLSVMALNTCNSMGLEEGQCVYFCRDGRKILVPFPPDMEHMGSRACLQNYNP